MTNSQLPFDAGAKKPAPLTVSLLVARIKEALLDTFPKRVSVVGQISNFKRHSSGHLYFSLKDA
ncbi:MAG: exodeoxyribonuclease VII large subunit, partial [Phycisphaerae bacterium]|nr:exodeoxyribonuclease VII large subunit [Phycisphaerae bacterium]